VSSRGEQALSVETERGSAMAECWAWLKPSALRWQFVGHAHEPDWSCIIGVQRCVHSKVEALFRAPDSNMRTEASVFYKSLNPSIPATMDRQQPIQFTIRPIRRTYLSLEQKSAGLQGGTAGHSGLTRPNPERPQPIPDYAPDRQAPLAVRRGDAGPTGEGLPQTRSR